MADFYMGKAPGWNEQKPLNQEKDKKDSEFGKMPARNSKNQPVRWGKENLWGKMSLWNQAKLCQPKGASLSHAEKTAGWNTAKQSKQKRSKKMFYSVKGILAHMEPGFAVIDCGGVGFKCFTTLNTQRCLRLGEPAMLYTYLNVREDALDLFGFATQGELSCFKLLTAISGVGPKAGLSILSELTPEQVAMAVARKDSKSFTKANGVGPKLAERIVLELRDKVKKMTGSMPDFAPTGIVSASSNAENAVNALAVLGYTPSDAAQVVARFDSNLPTEELIRLSLREMGRSK